MTKPKKPVNVKEPDYKVGDELKVQGQDNVVTVVITKVHNTAVPAYDFECRENGMPGFLSEPVLKRCLVKHSETSIGPPADNIPPSP